MNINSYPTVYQIGHNAIQDIFADEVLIEEKVEGNPTSSG